MIKDSKGRKGILVVGGTGDKVKKNFLSKFPSKLPELCWRLRGVLGLGQRWCRVGEDAQTSRIAVLLANGGQSFSLFLGGVPTLIFEKPDYRWGKAPVNNKLV